MTFFKSTQNYYACFFAGNYTQIILADNKLTNFQSSVFQSMMISIVGYNNSNSNYYYMFIGGSKENNNLLL